MNTKFFGGLLLVALVASGIHAYATNQGAETQAPAAVQSTQSLIYGTVYDSVYPGSVSIGHTVSFWINDYWNSSYSVDVFVSSLKDEDEPLEDTSRYSIISRTNDRAEIVFNQIGIYYANFRVYDGNGQLVAAYKSQQVVVGN